MITYKDIKLAVNEKLSELGIEINSNDVKEGFARPSFFVSFDNIVRSSSETQVHHSLTIEIYYFPKERLNHSLELLEMQNTLAGLFDYHLEVLDRKFVINEIQPVVTDGVLILSFDIEFYDGKEIIDVPTMEELDFERVK